MIPKIIHYCWFSEDKKPLPIRRCIKSWQRVMPDYEIREWDGKSFDFDSVPFVKQAIEHKKWAFAADYIRLYALYTEGGIYLDSDVFVYKRFDCFLNHAFFTGTERVPVVGEIHYYIEAAIMGAQKNNPLVACFLKYYQNRNFIFPDGSFDCTMMPRILTNIIQTYGYQQQDETQLLSDGITIYSTHFFDNELVECHHPDIYARHRNYGSWIPSNRGILYRLAKKYDCIPFYRRLEKLTQNKTLF